MILDLARSKSPYQIVEECFKNFKGRDIKDAGLKL